jgi:cytosine/adenosine deaminase-related metal-dependent hydrolase
MSGARGRIGPGSDDVDPRRPAETGERSVDPTTASLAREVYWASDGASRPSAAVGSLRGRLDAFIQQMRADERQLMPFGETLLGSAAGWKRRTKLAVWRLTRFSTKRYDRLLADLAEMNRELAQRLHETEEEVARLREEHGNEGGEPS